MLNGNKRPHGYFTYLRQSFHTSSCWSGSELLWFSLRSCKHLAGTAPTSPVWPALSEAALPVELFQSYHCCCHLEDPHCFHLGMNLHSTLVCEQYWRYKKNRHSSGHFNPPLPSHSDTFQEPGYKNPNSALRPSYKISAGCAASSSTKVWCSRDMPWYTGIERHGPAGVNSIKMLMELIWTW